MIVAICLVVAGCGAGPATPTAPTASTTNERAATLQGRFQLVFDLARGSWKAGDVVEGFATLALVDGVGVDLSGSGGGLFGFDFAEVNGTRHVAPVSTADCGPYRLELGKPMMSAIRKSGGISDDDPNADFYRAFLTDPIVRLPAGDWTITAIADFIEGKTCSGASRRLTAPIVVHITP